ncbi:trypsin-like peptidase domain-containing protein [Streptomyces sp.]|uniref:VMAP-C domain-containing protein n=1 Tax=Streptomyces sp. TaxID=1931 RepID=UPI002D272F24|nr:trypsin-like peptidase domain-containing protein [Streptomyces sp.]HZF92608.1 trypsin-like peptidase domain-containing protein [Streptomyces sp.]
MTARLEQLATRATVRIGPYDTPGTLWGSGFLVAPGWVLTCAHVLPLARGAEAVGPLRVQGYRLDVRARLGYWLGGGGDPDEDLALVRLLDPVPVHACVRLTDRYDTPHRVTALGWRTPQGGQPQRWTGHSECNGRDGSYGLTVAPNIEIPHGASGGPLLDRDNGVVAGIVKARRAHKDGGLAVAVTALRGFREARPVGGENGLGADPYAELIRAHDRWHQKTRGALSWVRTQSDVCGGARSWSPWDSAEAAALLAGLPRPASVAQLQRTISLVLGNEPYWEDELVPVDWRDGLGWVHDQPDGADIIALHYLQAVVRACRGRAPDAAAELEHWVKTRVQELPDFLAALLRARAAGAAAGLAECVADDGPGPVVAVELEPDLYRPGDRFHWRVWSWSAGPGTARVLDEDGADEGVSLAELPDLLEGPLGQAFRQLDTEARRTRLELAVPVEHFGLHAHRWPLGARRPVVLRCLKRRGEPAAVWKERWDGVAGGGLKSLPVQWPEHAKEALEAAPHGAVPVLCRPPQENADSFAETIRAGYGVALWSLRNDHTRVCGTDCGDLFGTAAHLLGSAGRASALPEQLHLRRESHGDTDWAHHMALLYDDPDRPLPLSDAPLDSP